MTTPPEPPPSPSRLTGLLRLSLPGLIFLVNLFLVHPAFLPNLSEINPFDEAAYIHSGRTLLDGNRTAPDQALRLPSLGGNPLVDVFYALTALPFRNSPLWLVHSATLGRLLLFSLLWLSAYLVARQMSGWAPPAVALGIFLVTPLAVEMLRFPSDPLFAALAGLSFWGLLLYRESGAGRHLAWASAFLGLAALARNDGLVLFPLFLLLAALLIWRSVERRWAHLGAALLPYLALTGGYLLLSAGVNGEFRLGTLERTYDNFEAGHQSIYAGTGELSPVLAAKLEARRVFGTPQENNYSVFNAIRRAPGVYLQRLRVTLLGLPQKLLQAYGLRFAALLFPLAGRGLLAILRRRQFGLAALFMVWPLHLASGFAITLFRPGHLMFPFALVFALAAVGLTALLADLEHRRGRYAWYALFLGLAAYGVLTNRLAIYYGAAILLVALWAVPQIRARFPAAAATPALPLLILLGAGLVIHGNFPTPKLRTLGVEAREQAVIFMSERLAPGTKVAAGSPGVVWAAGLTYANLASTDTPLDKSPVEFLDWMTRQNIQAVYVDHSLYNTNPRAWGLIKPHIGQGIERVFTADQGDIQVLLLQGN